MILRSKILTKMKKILVTGSSGFIGRAVCRRLLNEYRVVAFGRSCFSVDNLYDRFPPVSSVRNNFLSDNPSLLHADSSLASSSPDSENFDFLHVKGDITDDKLIRQLCNTHKFDAVIHCAGIAHQKSWKIDTLSYENINAKAVRQLADAASASNPEVYFIFLSSISVYGEENSGSPVKEDSRCIPTSEYGKTKLKAENYLKDMFNREIIRKTDILRLSPVYDVNNSFNIDKRIFAPGKYAYIVIGKGRQKMSALARANLADFIHYRLNSVFNSNDKSGNNSTVFCNTYNICDKKPYSFKRIIGIFKKSPYQPHCPVIGIPVFLIKILTGAGACIMRKRRSWFRAAYKKVSNDLVFDNKRMLETGFVPLNDLSSVFLRSHGR